VFLAGGHGSGSTHDSTTQQTAVYLAASGTWKQTSPNMNVARHAPALANLPNGCVLVMGGCQTVPCGNTVLPSAEICCP
jgi:hypothetical protein